MDDNPLSRQKQAGRMNPHTNKMADAIGCTKLQRGAVSYTFLSNRIPII